MSNMSYCRFRNTYEDLKDCVDNMKYPDQLLPEEQSARRHIIELAKDIIYNHGHEINVDVISTEE